VGRDTPADDPESSEEEEDVRPKKRSAKEA
jgi:hypothetical protein